MMYYYKIISTDSFFALLCKEYGIDIFNIPYGTEFIAPKHPKQKPVSRSRLLGDDYFHFCDCAFDTMLWYTQFSEYDHVIYKIEPLDILKKARCNDDLGIYQCGTTRLKILELQDIGKMYDQAVVESQQFSKKYNNFEINIDDWKKHKPTPFFVWDSYYIPR